MLDVRTALTNALADPAALHGWQIALDDGFPEATDADFAYADSIE